MGQQHEALQYPWYVNAKIYKGFINNTFSVTLEAKDLFNSSQNDAIMYNDAVHIVQKNFSPVDR